MCNFALPNEALMTINYQYWSAQFVGADAQLETIGDEAVVMDDSDLEACFSTLVDGQRNVVVRLSRGGMRRLERYLMARYRYVKAAGGLVGDLQGRWLLMTRNDRADLPKGKVEAGETLAQAALRETQEETGLQQLALGPLALKTYHIYDLYGGWHLKQTAWFHMVAAPRQQLTPQTEEGITDCRWVDADQWRRSLADSYATMRLVAAQPL